jgi:hypothetical protein
MGSAGTSFRYELDLDTGAAKGNWHGSDVDHWVPHERQVRREFTCRDVPPDELEMFRELANQMRDTGPYEYRDQFAQAGVEFGLTDGDGRCVLWKYHLDGGPPLDVERSARPTSRVRRCFRTSAQMKS